MLHYELTQTDMRIKCKSQGDFGSHPICGNGQAHLRLTKVKKIVTCSECKKELKLWLKKNTMPGN